LEDSQGCINDGCQAVASQVDNVNVTPVAVRSG
jgi:hypothetical protein